MRVEQIKISGFRGFNNFDIESSGLTGFIILAGQNGTGKSTVLEIVNFILRNADLGIIDTAIRQGVTSISAEWELKISLDAEDIKYLVGKLKEGYPQVYDSINAEGQVKKSLLQESGKFYFSIKITIPSLASRDNVKRTFNGPSGWVDEIPEWFNQLATQSLFVVYVNPLQEIGEGGLSIFGGRVKDLQMNELTSADADMRKRGARTNVNLTNLLNRLALIDLLKKFERIKTNFPILSKELERINDIISPLEIFLDVGKLKDGEIIFKMRNNKLKKEYQITYASAGERQVIGIAALMVQWQRQTFKQVILIDEPDTHLHPEFAKRLAKFMKTTFQDPTEFSCLIATHSPDFIGENLENVYQITTDSTTIEKINNLEMRANLLQQLGKSFDLSFLIPHVVLVEGIDRSSAHLEDYEIYQRLIDKDKNKVVFIPSGSVKDSASGGKIGVVSRTLILKSFLKNLTKQDESIKLTALIDLDRERIFGKTDIIKYTPFTNLENIFLLDLKAVVKVTSSFEKKFDSSYIKKVLEKKEKKSTSNLLKLNGKKHFDNLFFQLAKDSQEIKNLGKKGFQIRILNNIKKGNLKDEVIEFFESFK